MWLVAGLGNPGTKYQNNRHNVGFKVVDELARRAGVDGFKQKFGGDVATCMLAGTKVLLLKPMEFMNLSGYAVQRAAAFHRIAPSEMVVIHDEIDLDFGRLRVKSSGGHGGNNGLRSIIEQLGDNDFQRVRVGVGKPAKNAAATGGPSQAAGGDRRVAGWVLSDFPAEMRQEVDELIERAADAATCVVTRGVRPAMNEFNADPRGKAKDGAAGGKKSSSTSKSSGRPSGAGQPN